jgi:uncharacterized membrane protein YkgB
MRQTAALDNGPRLQSRPLALGSLPSLAPRLESLGGGILRYGLVAILLALGLFKFTAVEAQAIQPMVANSPLLGWLYSVLSLQGVSNLIGVAEVACAVLIALRRVAPRLSALGSVGAIFTFLTTLSFLFTTPGVMEQVPGMSEPVLSMLGGFLLKDLFLLGAAVWSAGEALRAASSR